MDGLFITYDNVHSKVKIPNCYSIPITVWVSVHQRSVLSLLFFIIAMETLSRVQNWCPWELLHVDNLVILAESLDEFKMRLINWKEGLQVKGLKELRWNRLRLSGHLYWQEETTCMNKIMSVVIDRPNSAGWLKLRLKDVVNSNHRKKCLSLSLASDRL